ncbi:paxneb protein superfamily [Paracoccidioides lutzii Pb01]|uniref:Elongator complex protein 4 n=1 Tax=Paracoccidioides lutzii (strain ATCC MYA-826 / Pb01) TaxID=502779 RepID=C1GUL5_PARBA|nr:paxneb protein superfamily [Paracoccidioides lutzii Pb01]EEH40283.1 paxneb protein superfamily [Paracoccidioides lutzii Pb01]
MSFRKRNIGLSPGSPRGIASNQASSQPSQPPHPPQPPPPPAKPILGLRPSPVDGRQTTSTGTQTLDNLLAGHAGFVLGNSLLIEERGTTDYAGALLRYYAAEGVVQEHQIHVIGVGEQWGRALPGLVGAAEAADDKKSSKGKGEKMKIAWRYERLGEYGTGFAGSRVPAPTAEKNSDSSESAPTPHVFCHTFDLTKRLTHPSLASINYVPLSTSAPDASPYTSVLHRLSTAISTSQPNVVHRIIIPSLLSPAIYPPHASQPEHLLQFLHSLRAILSTNSNLITAMITLPLSLYPRTSGLTRWIELLSDGVIELAPFPHLSDTSPSATSGAATAQEEPPQGMLKIHRLPVLHERGGGGDSSLGDDWAFTLSRRKFTIKLFNLPPVEGDTETQQGIASGGTSKKDLEF